MAQQTVIDIEKSTLEVEDPDLVPIYRKIYKIVAKIHHPSILRVFSVTGRSPLRITVEEFSSLPPRALTLEETRSLRDGIRLLQNHGIVLTRILRSYLGWVDGKVKFCLFADAGIVSPTNPYKWKMEPLTLDKTKRILRSCDFDAYISGIYKLSEFTACAERRFFMANAARRKRELKREKSSKKKREAARGQFRLRHYLQTGQGLDKISTPVLQDFLGISADSPMTRPQLERRLQQQRAERNRRRLQQIQDRQTKAKTLRLTQQTDPREIFEIQVLDPILYQERPLRQIIKDPETDYKILLVTDENGITRPALYENRTPEIVYRCVQGRPWQDYLTQETYFFNIRTFEGDRYLVPRMNLPRVLVIEPTEDSFRVVSKEAVEEMDFVSRLHCQPGAEMRLFKPQRIETQRINQMLRIDRS